MIDVLVFALLVFLAGILAGHAARLLWLRRTDRRRIQQLLRDLNKPEPLSREIL